MKKKITYKKSGVDIHKANVFVRSIQGLSRTTVSKDVLKRKGSFGSLFVLDVKRYKQPVLVSSTDGVGTKLLIANMVGKHDTVGIDLVAMNVNDVVCTGAKPLFFLDYIACGKLNPSRMKQVAKGIVEGCRQAGCALIGGETAEMPDMYRGEDYDLAGFAAGIVSKSKIIDGSKVKVGDVLIGLASNGLHSNGFSLVRKALTSAQQRKLSKTILKPTRIYVKPVLALLKKVNIKGIAHITGGAFYEKLTKIIPDGKCCQINKGSWPVPEIFRLIQRQGNVPDQEMYKTFNMGIGMVLVVAPKDVPAVTSSLQRSKVKCFKIGTVVADKRRKIVL